MNISEGVDAVPRSDGQLARLEDALRQITGVTKVHVVGTDTPSEIHVVAQAGRSPKQIVRDIQSVASASIGISVDHRVVSIVQLEEADTNGATQIRPRTVLDSVVVASRGSAGWVKVRLRLPNAELHEGTAPSANSREGRAKAAVAALLLALEGPLTEVNAQVEIDQVMVYAMGNEGLVWLTGTFTQNRATTPISGAAIVVDDTATAAAHASLHALNRVLRLGEG
ncbi:MAG: hypothetical protein M3238_05035 [Actinomycetota bacterium]|nr:hypothetical protein [Actinomycetota bacterium]